jgi:ubiquinone/menaquinone biosynthesis C-methylase UbiE
MSTKSPDVQTYTDLARDYDRTRYIGQANLVKEGFRRDALLGLLPTRPDMALDVACGTGRGALILHEVSSVAVGIDGTLAMLEVARDKFAAAGLPVRFCQGNAAALPFASARFDLVTCLNFVHLFSVPEKRVFVREIARVLKPGGVAVVEFDNAFAGVVLGVMRKYFVKDIGYDWPWDIRSCFPRDLFTEVTVRGTNLPGVWRIRPLHRLERLGHVFPFSHVGGRILARAVRGR